MINTLAKISLILGLTLFIFSCNAVKRVEENQLLLTDSVIMVDSVNVKDAKVNSQLVQKPNPRVLGVPIGIFIYNLADPAPDSTFQKWLHRNPNREQRLINFLSEKQVVEMGNSYIGFNKWLERSGTEPVVIEEAKAKKSADRLKRYYASFGWFNSEASYRIDTNTTKEKRGSVYYSVTRHQPYFIDSIVEKISSPIVDSLFQATKNNTFIKKGKQFENNDLIAERDRLTIQFRNSGLYHFDQDYITFDADTVNTGHKANITYIIPDRRVSEEDSTHTEPFKIHTINEVRVVTDYTFSNRNKTLTDSASFKGYTLYSYEPLRFRPKAITDAISITPNTIFKDIDRTLTYSQISDLRIFKYPNISYIEDPKDTTSTGLIATILLSPQKNFTLGVDFDAYTSTIQQFGIGFSGNMIFRNVFRGAEILEVSGRGSVGSSKDAADNESLFNISEVGGDVKLSFPTILFPLNTDKLIPKYMSPSTTISVGLNAQNNIGLDRQHLNSVFSYRWKPTKIRTNRLDLMNIQYVRHLNTENYFNIYRSSYDRLNEIAQDSGFPFSDPESNMLIIPDETQEFIDAALTGEGPPLNLSPEELDEILGIDERRFRLTENNLIFATNFTWTRDSRENIFDNNFSRLRWKIEAAGNLLSVVSGLAGLEKDENGKYRVLGVAYSQYAKGEIEYIKHWLLSDNTIFAVRLFGGIAVPYGNSESIPFTRSYFAGGANDNRGWRPYNLGPGSSGSFLDFNEANFKLAFNAEYRYTIIGDFKGAFFADVGNIWNVFDNVKDEASRFNGIGDLKELAFATGFGLRYDFGFFVLRFDVGFKTYNPALPEDARWFKEYNFRNAVYNIGINYPF